MKVLVDETEERAALQLIRANDLRQRFNSSVLGLTIAPTLSCNFACTYCFEQNRQAVHMDDETEDLLIAFVQRFLPLRELSIVWFGGEPFLRLGRMASITKRLESLGVPFNSSAITNGYLLDDRVIPRLNELHIRFLQVTLDGDEATHDARRFTAAGGKTYARILSNIDALMSAWDGRLAIRVNIDRSNGDSFRAVHEFLSERYRGKRVSIDPGFVEAVGSFDRSCELDREEATLFQIEQYRAHGIQAGSFYPRQQAQGCIAMRTNGFVIGPSGEIYRCWNDMGDPARVVGSIRPGVAWDTRAITDYVVGTDLFDDPECRECFFLPVCNGGCPRLRRDVYGAPLASRARNGTCAQFREHLSDYLEIHYEIRQAAAARRAAPG